MIRRDDQYVFPGGDTDVAEAKRQRVISTELNPVSISMLLASPSRTGRHVVDLGAGVSPDLGNQLQRLGYSYTAVDISPLAEQPHTQSGNNFVHHDLRQGVPSGFGDEASLVHARLIMGWLSETDRANLFEGVRTLAKNTGRVCLIDYDWSDLDGPESYMELVGQIGQFLQTKGFDPVYGKERHQDFKTATVSHRRNTRVYPNVQRLSQAITGIQVRSVEVAKGLRVSGEHAQADRMIGDLEELSRIANDPSARETYIKQPSLVATVVDFGV